MYIQGKSPCIDKKSVVKLRFQNSNVGKCAVAAGKIETISHHELILDGEAQIVDFDGSDSAIRL